MEIGYSGTPVNCETRMSILVDKHTKVITQGMTGETGTFHTEQAR